MFVKTSARGLAVALIPVAAVQCALFAMQMIGVGPNNKPVALVSPDRAFVLLMSYLAAAGACLMLAHYVLRRLDQRSRTAYAAAGLASGAICYAAFLTLDLAITPPLEGARITAGILPSLAGMVAGFLYQQTAGHQHTAGPEVPRAPQPESPQPSGAPAPMPSRFAGPVRVRTSFGAILLASFIPALFIALFAFTFGYTYLADIDLSRSQSVVQWSTQAAAFAFVAQIFLTTAMMTVVPAAIVVLLAHQVARALALTKGLHYAGLGAAVGVAAMLFFVPLFPAPGAAAFFLLPSAILGAVMSGLYRAFAGLEPVPLPEPVLVREPETLVLADHPSRHSHAVILNG